MRISDWISDVCSSEREVRECNATALFQHWRGAWTYHVNSRCAALGIDARIDHRSYAEQGIALEPQHKIGASGARREANGEDAERADDHRAIARSKDRKSTRLNSSH